MKNIKFPFILLCIVLAYSCSPKVAPVQQNYSENLDAYIPDYSKEIKAPKVNAPASTPNTVKTGAPINDINSELQGQIDHFAKSNQSKGSTYYTIQIYSGGSRTEANEIREQIYEFFPSAKPYLQWKQPNYRVKVGKFYNRLEANPLLLEIKKHYHSAILVPEVIKTEVEESEEEKNTENEESNNY
ncbi:SPOR domain-containing protein [Aureibacter tunicatorum]|uniref:SPOR domain-containing protein n=1 Tax=Aureibacter tunicatorum TaxID=866807 RepID=A0AAE3XMC4_9BACT|nr:SPOR domain-containing protein [Aureibacter tunicatorum]MDR6237604.1 hypothetical protein [Aureibacter tunicatorum]BDD02638.1 hypothetical protein AUTU_01210 [Aureibacter tunicatorum]